MTEVGRVAAVWRYPVKSMGADQLEAAELSWNGMAGDRRWAFIRDGMVRSGFPWLTIRELPTMGRYRPRFAQPERPDGSAVLVRTPSGGSWTLRTPRWPPNWGTAPGHQAGSRRLRHPPALPHLRQTLAGLGALVEMPLDVQRFRPNLLIEAPDGGPFPETLGRLGLRIGGARVRVDKRDERCVMVNVDPATSERDPAVAAGDRPGATRHAPGSTGRP